MRARLSLEAEPDEFLRTIGRRSGQHAGFGHLFGERFRLAGHLGDFLALGADDEVLLAIDRLTLNLVLARLKSRRTNHEGRPYRQIRPAALHMGGLSERRSRQERDNSGKAHHEQRTLHWTSYLDRGASSERNTVEPGR